MNTSKAQLEGRPVEDKARDAASTVQQGAREVAQSRWLDRGARLGMLARSIVYLVLAWLALEIALGKHAAEADQNGALRSVGDRTGGQEILGALAAGFAVYALWRLSAVFFGDAGSTDARARLDGAVGFVGYGGLCITAVSLLLGSGNTAGGSARQATSFTARVMKHSGGRAAVILIGVIVVVVGGLLVVEGIRRSFADKLRTEAMSARATAIVTRIGVVGNVARGLVIALIGALLIDTGWTADPKKSRGLDGALETLARSTAGPWLLIAVAVGFLCFAVYSVAESRYRRT